MALHLLDLFSSLSGQEAVSDSCIYLLGDVWICDPKSSDILSCLFSEALTAWAVLGLPNPPCWNLYALRELVHMSSSLLNILVENTWFREGPVWMIEVPRSKTLAGGAVPPREGCQPWLLDSPVFWCRPCLSWILILSAQIWVSTLKGAAGIMGFWA